jgi:hypothetical protein
MGATLTKQVVTPAPSAAEPVPAIWQGIFHRCCWPYFKASSFDATFFTGLDLLLDGIEMTHKDKDHAKPPV